MSSVRVARGSGYATLRGGDERDTNNPRDSTGRPRSRTITSIFQRPVSSATRQSQVDVADEAAERPGEGGLRSVGSAYLTADRRESRVVESIMRHSRFSANRGDRATRQSFGSSMSPTRGQPGAVTLEGNDVDIVIPTDGRPGIVESALSLDSVGSYYSVDSDQHGEDIIEHLDVIDPQIATVSNLSNAANSILIPPIPMYSRKPLVVLPRTAHPVSKPGEEEKGGKVHEDDLDRHIEDVLGRRDKFRRTMQGLWAFLKTPQGIITAIYGFLVVFWGAAIVFFLAKFINFHNAITQGFWVEVSSQVENALFTVTGVGFIPWRVLDTYRIIRIWHFKRLTRKLRKEKGLPELYDEDDLPDPVYDPNYVHVLTEKQQKELHHVQEQFMKSQSWYRPHGTTTHRAFPINTALLICLLVDGNSFFQCILCGTMWGLNRFQRPPWSTGSLIPLSFGCGIGAAVFIYRGGHKTKRTKEVEERLRIALAMEEHPQTFPLEAVSSGESRRSGVEPPTIRVEQNRPNSKDERDGVHSIVIEENMSVPAHSDIHHSATRYGTKP